MRGSYFSGACWFAGASKFSDGSEFLAIRNFLGIVRLILAGITEVGLRKRNSLVSATFFFLHVEEK